MQTFVSDYLQPICRLLVYLNPVLLVAQADRINLLLHRANNRLSYEHLVRGMEPQHFPWHYDPNWSTPVIFRILGQPAMRGGVLGLRGWQASSFLDRIVTVSSSSRAPTLCG